MNIIREEEFDYQAYMRDNPPDVTQIRRGTADRQRRFEAATRKQTIRIEADVLAQFQQLVPEGQAYEHVINQALREWLAAQNVKDLVREELHQILQESFTSIQGAVTAKR